MFQQLARTVDVGEPQGTGAHAEDVVVDEMVVLAGRLVDPVDVGRPHELRFGDRQRIGPPVHLARAGEHDFHLRIVVAARLEHGQLAAAVDLEIRVRIAHAVDVAHLSGEAEDHVAPLHEIVHRGLLPDVGDVHAHALGDAVDVEQVAAVVGDERVDQEHVGAEVDELPREVAADEPEAAGDHHGAAAVEGAIVHHQVRGGLGQVPSEPSRAASDGAPARRWRRRITSSYHRRITSTPVFTIRGTLKNCDFPNARW